MATSEFNRAEASGSVTQEEEKLGEFEDLVGVPYAVIESDPVLMQDTLGVFTSILQKLDISLQAQEVLTLDSLAGFQPYGFVLCFKWYEDSYIAEDYQNDEPDTQVPWFANQLSNDSCAILALLNIVLNCGEEVHIGPFISSFKDFTKDMDPVIRGLCIASSKELRQVHNSFARPADIRASTSKIAHSTIKFPKKPTKAKRSSKLSSKSKRAAPSEAVQDQYHFLSYVPYRGRVWEMDGLKSAPLECAELDPDESWLEAVRPALRGRIEALAKSGDIRFNLLAIVPCAYHTKMREFELTKREIKYIERRLQDERGENWKDMVNQSLWDPRNYGLSKDSLPTSKLGIGFGARSNELGVKILRMDPDLLPKEWENCIRCLVDLQMAVDDELRSAKDAVAEHIKRTHDYDPFIREYVSRLYNAGLLHDLLDIDKAGRLRPSTQLKAEG